MKAFATIFIVVSITNPGQLLPEISDVRRQSTIHEMYIILQNVLQLLT